MYSEPRYIQNAGIFKIGGIFRYLPHIYDETLINFTAVIIFTNYNYLRKICRVEIDVLEVLSSKVVMLSAKLWRTREPWSVNF